MEFHLLKKGVYDESETTVETKNPIMEEACQAYHKQTAPTEAVTVVENLEIFYKGRRNEYLEKEIVKTTTWGDDKITVVLFYVKGEEGKITQAVGTITVKGKRRAWVLKFLNWLGRL